MVGTTAWLGSRYTASGVGSDWYECVRPSFTPPAIVFPVAWSVLYVGIGLALAHILATGGRSLASMLSLFMVNLAANAAWCKLFFQDRTPRRAMGAMAVLLVTAVWIVAAAGLRRWQVSAPMTAYAAWLAFAATLNVAAARNEPSCTAVA